MTFPSNEKRKEGHVFAVHLENRPFESIRYCFECQCSGSGNCRGIACEKCLAILYRAIKGKVLLTLINKSKPLVESRYGTVIEKDVGSFVIDDDVDACRNREFHRKLSGISHEEKNRGAD
jgi:hypothetical protein